MALCTAIKLIEHDPHYGDLLDVEIDNEIHALWYFPNADAMQYLNQEVIVDYRSDMYRGQMKTFIKTFTLPCVVHTLDREEGFKLFIDSVDDGCNVVFSEFAENDSKMGCTVFCTHQEYKSSDKSAWMELIIRDKTMHTAKCRIFDYTNSDAELEGRYILANLVRSKYGFQTHEATPLNADAMANPEIPLAEQFIKNFFSSDVVAMDYVNRTNLLEVMKTNVDYELGYGLMRLAMELSIVDAMRNVTCDVDLNLVAHGLLTSYGHLTRKSNLSPSFNNVLVASQYKWPNKDVVLLLDDGLEERPNEYKVMQDIKRTVGTLLEIRKGTTYGR